MQYGCMQCNFYYEISGNFFPIVLFATLTDNCHWNIYHKLNVFKTYFSDDTTLTSPIAAQMIKQLYMNDNNKMYDKYDLQIFKWMGHL